MGTQQVQLMIRTLKVNYGESLEKLFSFFASRKYEIRFAGETARDLIMNKIPKKMDLVSSASLHQMKKMFIRGAMKISVEKKNAAITVRFANLTYTITTICPVETKISPTCEGTTKAYWIRNAYDRTFTVHSLFVDMDGRIYNYFNGYDDVVNYHIRMILDPDALIKTDPLRIFEYFRLFGSLALAESEHDRKTLKAIVANINGLESMRGERIWDEFKTILMQPKRYECVEAFFQCGGATCLGLPEELNFSEFDGIARNSNFAKHPLLGITYLCAFLQTNQDVINLHRRLRLSAYERDLATFIVKYKETTRDIDDLVYYRKMCLLPSGVNKQISREYVLELLKFHNKKYLFGSLLKMESPSHVIDPVALQWKKSQLRRITVEAAHGSNDLWYAIDGDGCLVKGQLPFELELSEKSSSMKKQRRH